MGDNRMFVFAVVLLFGCLCFVSVDSARTGEFQEIVGRAKAVQSEVLRILNDEATWNDETQKETPAGLTVSHILGNEAIWNDETQTLAAIIVELATRLPSKEYLPPLLRHVTRKFQPDMRMRTPSLERAWPVAGAIAAIGPAAVPDLIERIKQIECNPSDEQAEEVKVLLECLSEIYGTHASYECVIKRIKCELDREHGEALTRLKCAADLLQFDDDSE